MRMDDMSSTAKLLAGKVAAVTGGTTGIGRAIALEYLQQGAKVVVNHRDGPSQAHFYASMKQEAAIAGYADCIMDIYGDISTQEAAIDLVQKTVETFGSLDIFVSNAGICQFAEFLEYV